MNNIITRNYSLTVNTSSPTFRTNDVNINPNSIKEKGLSTGAKWCIGLGLTALATVGICLVTKRKMDAKKFTQLLEEDKKLLDALPVRENSFKGNTITERIKNILGADSKISPHSYDLTKEYPAIPIYRNQGGYKDGLVLPRGIVDPARNQKAPRLVTTSISHKTLPNNRIADLIDEQRLVSGFEFKDPRQKAEIDTDVIFKILSPNDKLTPAQMDLEKIKSNPKLKAEAEKLFDEALKFMRGNDNNGKIIFENIGKYEHLDYDVILSIIQSLAKKAV